ncbi:MAG: FAD-dependent oxidoreductase [Pseudomonadota bacterium]
MSGASDSASVVIVGGGAIGLSVAYHLGQLGCEDVLLVERNELTSGTSWHAAGIIGPLRASRNLTQLAIYATKLLGRLEAETGQSTGYRQTGGLWLAQSEDRLTELKRIAAMGDLNGLTVEILDAGQTAERLPLLRCDDLAGALWVAEDGMANPVDLCMAYAKGARAKGVRIREHCGVAEVDVAGGAVRAVVLDDGTRVACGALINCAGAWAGRIARMAGQALPVQAAEHMYVVTEPVPDLPQPFPILRDLAGGIYIKEDAGKLVLGGFERDAKPWDIHSVDPKASFLMLPEDYEQFEPFLEAGLHRLPLFETLGIQTFMNGPESFTPDTKQAMGRVPGLKNGFVAAGFNSIGIMSSAGVGQAMAAWVLDGQAPMDLWEVDVARFEPNHANRAFLHARLEEVVHNQLAMHWPFKQMTTGRGIKRTPLHRALAKRGAVFGAPAGWERPLWFAEGNEPSELSYSYGAQCWWPAAAREAKRVMEEVALFDLTPFTKILIEGADGEAFLQRICANNLAVAPGKTVYTPLLNPRGGIEADVTVTRLDDSRFWLVSGAATRIKDLDWIRRQIAEKERVAVTDMTSAFAVIGVMGPKSRDLLSGLTSDDLSAEGFAFGTAREIDLAMARVRATRISFVGDLGWELTVPLEFAQHVHGALCDAGAGHAGMFCLDACRLEKGYRHWGHDIGPDDSPLEAGLGFTVAFEGKGDFIGRDALLRQKEEGLGRRQMLFDVQAERPLLLHDEPVFRDGKMVGHTTSGGLGFRSGRALCFAYVPQAPGERRADLLASAYEISVAGERFAMTALDKAPYDPLGTRLRG